MTPMEVFEVFEVADKNNNGLVSVEEWKSFYNAFVLQFDDKCDIDHDAMLDDIEVKMCFGNFETAKSMMNAMDKYTDLKAWDKVVNILSARS